MADGTPKFNTAKEYAAWVASKRPKDSKPNCDLVNSSWVTDPFHVPLISEIVRSGPAVTFPKKQAAVAKDVALTKPR